MITLENIAMDMGLSQATVSNALSGRGRMKPETREAIVRRTLELGYVPARKPRRNDNAHPHIIAITENIRHAFIQRIFAGITEEAYANGTVVPIYCLNEKSAGMPRVCDAEKLNASILSLLTDLKTPVDGIVFVSTYPQPVHGLMNHLRIPHVSALFTRDDGGGFVHYDERQGAKLAVETLVKYGYRHIAMISGPIDSVNMVQRTGGYQSGLVENGLVFDPALMKIGDWTHPSGYAVAKALLTEYPEMDAIFSQNDNMAIGALYAIRELGKRVPEDMAVIGFDDSSHVYAAIPPLTSVSPPYEAIGQEAYRMLVNRIHDSAETQEGLILPCTLSLRGTTPALAQQS